MLAHLKRHGHNFRRRGPKTNSVFRNPLFKNAIRFGTSHSKIVAVSFFRYGVLLVKKKLKRGSTSEGRNSAWNHQKLYVPYIFWKPRPCSFTWCYPIYVIHMTAFQYNHSFGFQKPMKVKVVKWGWKKWNEHDLMHIYHKQCEIIQKIEWNSSNGQIHCFHYVR